MTKKIIKNVVFVLLTFSAASAFAKDRVAYDCHLDLYQDGAQKALPREGNLKLVAGEPLALTSKGGEANEEILMSLVPTQPSGEGFVRFQGSLVASADGKLEAAKYINVTLDKADTQKVAFKLGDSSYEIKLSCSDSFVYKSK